MGYIMRPLLKSPNMDPTGSIGNLQAHDWPWVLLPTGRRGFSASFAGTKPAREMGFQTGFDWDVRHIFLDWRWLKPENGRLKQHAIGILGQEWEYTPCGSLSSQHRLFSSVGLFDCHLCSQGGSSVLKKTGSQWSRCLKTQGLKLVKLVVSWNILK